VGPDGLALSPTAIALMEDAIRGAAAASTLASALEIGYRAFGASACTAAAREGIGAFGEHRRADFTKTG
jgi:enoyl-CoA hydratase/3-hydroxyacyl-CoA dehydrogenase